MKRFLIKVSVFLIGLVMFDFMVGMCCRYLVNHAKGGDTGLNNYICHKMTEDLIGFQVHPTGLPCFLSLALPEECIIMTQASSQTV